MEPNLDEKENVVKGRRRSSILKQTRPDIQLDGDSNQTNFNKENVTGGFTKSYRRVSFADEVRARVYPMPSPYSEAKSRSLKPNNAATVEDKTSLKPATDLVEPEKPNNSIIKMDIQKHLFDKHYILSSPSKRPLQELQKDSVTDAVSENIKSNNEVEAAPSFDGTECGEDNMDLTGESVNLDKSVFFQAGTSDMSVCTVGETPNVSLIDAAPQTQMQVENLCESMELIEQISGKIIELSPQKVVAPFNFSGISETDEQQDANNSSETFSLLLGGRKPSFFATSSVGHFSGFMKGASLGNPVENMDVQKVLPHIQKDDELQDSCLEADEREVSKLISAPIPAFIKKPLEKTTNDFEINGEVLEVSSSQPLFPVIQTDEAMQDSRMSLEENDLEASNFISAFIKEHTEPNVKVAEVNDKELEISLSQQLFPVIETHEAMQDSRMSLEENDLEASNSISAFIKENIETSVKVSEANDKELEVSLSQSLFPVNHTEEAMLDSRMSVEENDFEVSNAISANIKEIIELSVKVSEVKDEALEVSLSQQLFPAIRTEEAIQDSRLSLEDSDFEVANMISVHTPAFIKGNSETNVKVTEVNDKELEVSLSQPLFPANHTEEAMQDSRMSLEENDLEVSNLISVNIKEINGVSVEVSEVNDKALEVSLSQQLFPAVQSDESMRDSILAGDELGVPKPASVQEHIETSAKVYESSDMELEVGLSRSLLPVVQSDEAIQDSDQNSSLEVCDLISVPKPAFIKDSIETTVKVSELNDEEMEVSLNQPLFPVIQTHAALQDLLQNSCPEEDELKVPEPAVSKEPIENEVKVSEVTEKENNDNLNHPLPSVIETDVVMQDVSIEENQLDARNFTSALQPAFFSGQEKASPKGGSSNDELLNLVPSVDLAFGCDAANISLELKNDEKNSEINEVEVRNCDEMDHTIVRESTLEPQFISAHEIESRKEKVVDCKMDAPLEMQNNSSPFDKLRKLPKKQVLDTRSEKENVKEVTERDIDLTLFSTSRNMFFHAPVSEAQANVTPGYSGYNNLGRTLQIIPNCENTPLRFEELNVRCIDASFAVEKLEEADKSVLNISQISERVLLLDRTLEKSRITVAARSEEDEKAVAVRSAEKTLTGEEDICSKTFAVTADQPKRISKNDRRLTYVLDELRKDKTFVKSDAEKSIIHGENNIELPLQEINSPRAQNLKSTAEVVTNEKTPKKVNNSKASSKGKGEERAKANSSTSDMRETRSKSKDKKREVSTNEASPIPKKRSRVKKVAEIPKSTKVVIPTKVALPKVPRSLEQRCSRLMNENLADSMQSTLHSSHSTLHSSQSTLQLSQIVNSSRRTNISSCSSASSCSEPKRPRLCASSSSSFETSSIVSVSVISVDRSKEKPFEVSTGETTIVPLSPKAITGDVKELTSVEEEERTLVAEPDGPEVPDPRPCQKVPKQIPEKTLESAKPNGKLVLTREEVTKSKVTKLNELRLQVFGVQAENKKSSVLTPDSEKEKILRMLDDAVERNRMERIRGRKAVADTLVKCEELERKFQAQSVEIGKDLDKLQFSLARITLGSSKQERGLLEIKVKHWSTSKIQVQVWTPAIEIHAVLGNEIEKPEFGPWNVLDNRVIESVDRSFNVNDLKSDNLLEFAHRLLWEYQNSMGHLLNTSKTSYDFIAVLKIIGEATYRSKMVFEDLEWIRDKSAHKFQLDGSQLTVWFEMPLRGAEFSIIFNLGLEMYSKDEGGVLKENRVSYKHIRGVTGEDRILSAVDSIKWGDLYIRNVVRAVDRWIYISKWYAL